MKIKIFLFLASLASLLTLQGEVVLGQGVAQDSGSGSIWIKTFRPGSANLGDPTIDRRAMAFVDSLMQDPNIEVQFFGGADNLKWKGVKLEVSKVLDSALRWERARKLRARYGRGEIGVTDEPIRGVKVEWKSKNSDLPVLMEKLNQLLDKIDFTSDYEKRLAALEDSVALLAGAKTTIININQSIFSDWQLQSGVMVWSAGKPWDLSVPYIGLALRQEKWALTLQGGVTPWSRQDPLGDRGDALLLGAISLYPDSWHGLKIGAFAGWEFFSHSDQWTMKVVGVTAGPNFRWKFWEAFLGYSIGNVSTLTGSEQWRNGAMFSVGINLK